MLQEDFGSTRALIHLLDVLPEGEGYSVLAALEGTLEQTRRRFIRRLAGEMDRLVASSCEELAAIAGLRPERFFDFSHPDCSDRICQGSRLEILRIDRTVGAELACMCRVLRKTHLTARVLRPYRLVTLSGHMENSRGLIEAGQAVLVLPGEPVFASPGATFLIPHPMATCLIHDAIRAGFPLRRPGHGPPLRLVSAHSRARVDQAGGR